MSEDLVNDLEKVGLFVDGPYDTLPITERPDIRNVMGRDKDVKDDPLRLGGGFPVIPGHKLKAASNDWTFSPFLSLWEKVKYDDPDLKQEEKEAREALNINDSAFVSTVGAKSMNGLGTYYGTFITNMEAFSPETRPKEEDDVIKSANFLTNPGKKGTGYGYLDVTINPYPQRQEGDEDPYFDVSTARAANRKEHEDRKISDTEFIPGGHVNEYFDPNPFLEDPVSTEPTYDLDRLIEKPGDTDDRGPWIPASTTKVINGNKDVMAPFEKFPLSDDPYQPNPYEDPPVNTFRKGKPLDADKAAWRPSMGHKTRQVRSVISYNVGLRVNSTNFHRYC